MKVPNREEEMAGENPEPKSGPGQPNVIDLVTHDPKSEEYALILVQTGEWEDSPQQLDQLKAKINNYLHFALDGDLVRKYPQAAGKPVRLQLDCTSPPSPKTEEFLAPVEKAVRQRGLRFVVNLL
jgi:hypothetical protein